MSLAWPEHRQIPRRAEITCIISYSRQAQVGQERRNPRDSNHSFAHMVKDIDSAMRLFEKRIYEPFVQPFHQNCLLELFPWEKNHFVSLVEC
jgi:hypothetical protein